MLNWTLLASIAVVLVLAAAAWWVIPQHQARKLHGRSGLTAKDIAELEDEYRKTMTQALGGIILLLSATVAFQQLYETRRSSEAQLRESARATDVTFKQQRLATGFELLGRRSYGEHLGGILLLNDWARSPSTDRSSTEAERYSVILPALGSFVREQTEFPVDTEKCEEFRRPASKTVESDVQAALDILRTQSTRGHLVVNLRGLNLSRANLSGATLSGSNFAFADLSEADLSRADLRNSNFYCANLYRADLSGADLSGDSLDGDGPSTNLAGAVLLGARLRKADGKPSSLARANLAKATLSEATLEETDLRGARLWEANLFRVKLAAVHVDAQTDLDKACLVEVRSVDTALDKAKNYDRAVKAESGHQVESRSWCASLPRDGIKLPAPK
jgi:uncharacterized protein YjbI with pentapeptide repeats